MRNIGGSVGIAMSTTIATRRAQTHQTYLVEHTTPYDPAFTQSLHQATDLFLRNGGDPVHATTQAEALIYGQVGRQAAMLAFIDSFQILAIALFCVLPIIWLMKKPPATSGSPPPAH
jgi:DHA2 family multidrug resistance protein